MSEELKVVMCKCGKNPATIDLHPCPYACEINDECEPACNCCGECSHECAMDI